MSASEAMRSVATPPPKEWPVIQIGFCDATRLTSALVLALAASVAILDTRMSLHTHFGHAKRKISGLCRQSVGTG